MKELTIILQNILSRENSLKEMKRVEKNNRGHSVDGVPVQKLRAQITGNLICFRKQLEEGCEWFGR